MALKRTNSSDPDFQTLIRELDVDLRVRNGKLMDVYDAFNVIQAIETVVIAYVDQVAAGCACFKRYDHETVEIKRMYVRPAARSKGISAMILKDLEEWALTLGVRKAILETGNSQFEALGLYGRQGYISIPNYAPYTEMPDSICFGKML